MVSIVICRRCARRIGRRDETRWQEKTEQAACYNGESEALGRRGKRMQAAGGERGCRLYRAGRVGPSQAEPVGSEIGSWTEYSCSKPSYEVKQEGDWGNMGVSGNGWKNRWVGVARMRLCAVGNVLLPEGLEPQRRWRRVREGADLEPRKSTRALARRTHGEDDRRDRVPALLLAGSGRMVN